MEATGRPHDPATLPPGLEYPVPIEQEVSSWPHSRRKRLGEQKNRLHMPGTEAHIIVFVAWSPYRLNYAGKLYICGKILKYKLIQFGRVAVVHGVRLENRHLSDYSYAGTK